MKVDIKDVVKTIERNLKGVIEKRKSLHVSMTSTSLYILNLNS